MLQTTMIEALAVAFALAYLALAIKRNIGCWAAAAISTTLYLFIFLEVKLYAEALLQIFYLIMAGYGFFCTGGRSIVKVYNRWFAGQAANTCWRSVSSGWQVLASVIF